MRVFTVPAWRLRMILAVYSYQGLVAGFGMTALPNHLAATGASAGAIGALMAMIGLPWALQPFWGPVVDGFGQFRMGRRRFWIVLPQTAALGCLALLPLAGDGIGAMPWLGAILMAHSACAALLDTAMDAMIIDGTPADRLGQATALTRTGFVGGTALGATAFAGAIPAFGLPATAGLLLLLAAPLAWVPLTVLESPGDDRLSLRRRPITAAHAPVPSHVMLLRLSWRLLSMMRQPAALALIALCVVEESATSVFGVRLAVEMIQAGGWDPAALSRLQSGLAVLGGTLGALSIGWWSDRIGPYRTLVVLFWLCAVAYAGSALLLLGPRRPGRGSGHGADQRRAGAGLRRARARGDAGQSRACRRDAVRAVHGGAQPRQRTRRRGIGTCRRAAAALADGARGSGDLCRLRPRGDAAGAVVRRFQNILIIRLVPGNHSALGTESARFDLHHSGFAETSPVYVIMCGSGAFRGRHELLRRTATVGERCQQLRSGAG
ncbi:MFS transporter [Dankookia sp. P2]|uniref:MFS transporter n=1 Tax=Dankookia sp. P2 TaxID=3423955 RepID=UPI003D6703D8